MKRPLFEFESYKDFLKQWVGPRTRRTGEKAAMAKALNCQATYISQVLYGAADLSLEQADQLNVYFGHTEDEAEFFLLLVQKERSGTASLQKYFSTKLEELKKKRMNLTARLGSVHTLTADEQARYYSSWHYAAVHIALSIPTLRTPKSIGKYLNIPSVKVISIIDFLGRIGLAVSRGNGEYEVGPSSIRLSNESPNIFRHHSNWRSQAVESLDREDLHDLHYSGIVTISKKDALVLKDRMLTRLKEDLAIVQVSPEEELYCLSMDLFSLGRNESFN